MLESTQFDIEYGVAHLRAPSFTIEKGEIGHLHGTSSSHADDICLYLGGLLNRLPRTAPAAKGRVVRAIREIEPSKLVGLLLNGKRVYDMSDIERAQVIGVVFGDPTRFFVGDTVLEEFAFAFAAAKTPQPDVQSLQAYGLYGKATRATEILSGGERHRLNLACVLELQPELLVADFSRCNLDSDFLTFVRQSLVDKAGERTAVVYGLPPGSFTGCNVKSLTVTEGTVSLCSPDASVFPTAGEEKGALAKQFTARTVGGQLLRVDMLHRRGVTQPVSFELNHGEVLQIRGPNGIGKTTLGSILVGRLKGKEVGGRTEPSLDEFGALMGLQDTERFFLLDSPVKDLVDSSVLTLCGFSDDEVSTRPRLLPFSRQKLLAISIVLSFSQGFAVLDEPTAGMDFADKIIFVSLLNHFSELAIVLFSHDQAIEEIGTVKQFEEIAP